jgi:NAD(P)-dependent dehydrogenase (short-subunit alcohol dehydrogenase family)
MLFVTRAASPHLIKNEHSSIVNLASLAGRKGGHLVHLFILQVKELFLHLQGPSLQNWGQRE